MPKNFDHTFALCAYKVNPHLEETVISLKEQSLKTNIIMITATPNEHICGIAEKHDIELFKANVTGNTKIKAAGGISSVEDAEEFIKLGASRLGTSRIVKAVKQGNLL